MPHGRRMSNSEFGAAFVAEAVSPERVIGVVRAVAGDEVIVGPIDVGPGGVAKALARGRLGRPNAERTSTDPLRYQIRIPVDLDVSVEVGGGRHRYLVDAEVRVFLGVHLETPLVIVIEPQPLTSRDVDVKVKAKGLQAKMIGRVGDIDKELRRHIAAYVTERIEADAADVLRIDLAPIVEDAWPTD